jgi:hypothetical protein
MSVDRMKDATSSLLVYIPCHTDYELALKQASHLRESFKNLHRPLTFNLKIVISTNGVKFTEEQIDQMRLEADLVVDFPFGIAGDINIALGFIKAIELKVDFLWILSANDSVSESALQSIHKFIDLHEDSDILVGASSATIGTRQISSVFESTNIDLPLGLISAVVYRTQRLAQNFDIAIQLNWTSWSQLAVIEAACMTNGGLNVSVVNAEDLYIRSERSFADERLERERVRKGYAFSFFGMPTIINVLHYGNYERRKKYLNGWIQSNWYLANFFTKGMHPQWHGHVASNRFWLKDVFPTAVQHAGFFHRQLFRVGLFFPLEKFREIKILKNLIRLVSKK